MSDRGGTRKGGFTGWHMLAITVGSFAVIIAVNFTMAFLATGTFPGLVVDNDYVASQEYNALLAGARAQKDAGWKADLSVSDGILRLQLADNSGLPRHGLAVTATAARPATAREDRTVVLADSADAYRAEKSLGEGLWSIAIEARDGASLVFRATQEILIADGKADSHGL